VAGRSFALHLGLAVASLALLAFGVWRKIFHSLLADGLFKEGLIYEQSATRTLREQQERRSCHRARQRLKIEQLRRLEGKSRGTQIPGRQSPPSTDASDVLAPLYASVSEGNFHNLSGDALEVIVFKCLDQIFAGNRRFAYQGQFRLDLPKVGGRYRKTSPPKNIGPHSTQKEADFFQFGHDAGPLCIECKNYREWTYPGHGIIKELIIKAADLDAIPVLIARRLHYTTRTNLLQPAGIIAHESLFQYYPADQVQLAEEAKRKDLLGFTDVTASEEPHTRTITFFTENLPMIVDRMARKWSAHKQALVDYAAEEINLAKLYTAIDSPAGIPF
jgi:hypothetical protein